MNTDAITVIGETLVDIVIHETRHDRECDTQESPSSPAAVPGGSAANVATALGRLGHPVTLETWLGDDAHGRLCLQHLKNSGVTVADHCLKARSTSTARALIDAEGAASYEFDIHWEIPPISVDPSHTVVHTGSLAAVLKPGAAHVRQAVEDAKDHALIVFDPNPRPAVFDPLVASGWDVRATIKDMIALADVVKASDEDIAWLYGTDDCQSIARQWVEDGASLAVVTRGGQGLEAWTAASHAYQEACSVEVVDTVGAGDTVNAGIIDALCQRGLTGRASWRLSDGELGDIVRHAARMAAITVSRAGANPPWSYELD